VFIKQLTAVPSEKLFIIGMYVDDYWTNCDDDAWDDFNSKWTGPYTASAPLGLAGSDFCGTSYTPNTVGSLSLDCGKSMTLELDDTPPASYPAEGDFDTPMVADALNRIRDPVSSSNPLVARRSGTRPAGSSDSGSWLVYNARGAHRCPPSGNSPLA